METQSSIRSRQGETLGHAVTEPSDHVHLVPLIHFLLSFSLDDANDAPAFKSIPIELSNMSQPSQADVFTALQAQASSSRPKPSSQPYGHFSNPEVDLVIESSTANSCSICCPREGCGSKILSPEAATWIVQPEQTLPDDSASPFLPHRKLSAGYGFWRVAQPFDFDNVGYSRAVASEVGPQAGKKIKWLICAECDLGPIGYGFEGEKEAFVSADRVLYGVPKPA